MALETQDQIEGRVRNVPANQGINEIPMWTAIDAEVATVKLAGNFVPAVTPVDQHQE